MNESTCLAQIVPNAAGQEGIWQAIAINIEASPENSGLNIHILSKELLTAKQIEAAQKAISKAYKIKNVAILPRFELGEVDDKILRHIEGVFAEKYTSLSAAFEEGKLVFTGSAIEIYISKEWVFRVEALKHELEKLVYTSTGIRAILEVKECETEGDSYEELRRKRLEAVAEEMQNEQANAPAPKPKQEAEKPKYERKKNPNAVQYKAPEARENVIYGKPVSRELLKICDVTMDSGKVTISGDIFFFEFRKLGGRGKTVFTCDMSDGTGSIRVNKVMDDEEAEMLKDDISNGMTVIVQGTAMYSNWDKETIVSPSAIIRGEKKVRRDNAEQKRVELHLHTNMSAMDGLCDTATVMKLAASMGHKAMAITDHGVAQAFPDAMNAVKKLKGKYPDFKALYGVEAYCLNDLIKGGVVKGFTDISIDDEIIVFDLETTGLKPAECEIIEIAAVLVKNGQVLDTFEAFVKPNSKISYEITNLTGITNETVANADKIEEVLPKFLEFCAERPMCAHNADFDISFIKTACERMGIERKYCSIDTVELSRALLPHLKKHKLNVVAEEFGFEFNHHRAIEDTNVLAKIFFKLMAILKEKADISKVAEINEAIQAIRDGEGIKKRERTHHLIILVRDQEGLFALYKMISLSHLQFFKKVPIIPMSLLLENREHLILGSACEAGELFEAVAGGKPWSDLIKIAKTYDFLEIQPIGNNHFMVAKGMVENESRLRDFNKTIVKLGDSLGIPVCATGDVHFIEPEDCIFREILMAGKGFEDAGEQPPLYFKTTEEMLKEFAYLGESKALEVVVTNTNKIADMCQVIQPVPDGTYPPSIEHSAEEIESMARTRAAELYGEELPQIVKDRLELELNSIIKHGFDVMYIIAQKLVAKSLEAGYLVGSRGSVGSSFVAYLTDITEVNALIPHYRCPKCKKSIFYEGIEYATGVDMPDKICPDCGEKMIKDGFGIPFATFLGFEGDKAPDIDLNFSGEYQTQAHRETIKLFGVDNVYKAGTIGTVKDKTAYGYVKKRLDEKGMVVSRAEENRLVQGCTGIKRTTGQHPGGLIVVPKGRSIYEFCPVQHPADDPESDIITTHFDYHSIHDNLLKLDLLGHDDPTMIRHLNDLSGMDPRTIPLDDQETMSIFTSLKPLGIEGDEILGYGAGAAAIPEFGTKFVRGMLEDTMPTTFDELLRISGLSHGTDVWVNNAKDIIKEGKATLKGVICVRDDITIYLMHMGLAPKLSFTISEAVRKGKGIKPEWEEEMTKHEVPEWYIESCKKIQYMFPRAHAVA